jgi:hypothetical protein
MRWVFFVHLFKNQFTVYGLQLITMGFTIDY